MHRIQLQNTVFEGENNAYLFDGAETVVVDTGVDTAETKTELERGLAEFDVTFADVDAVLVTHYHGDHSGLVATIQRESDASVHVHEADAALTSGDPDAWAALLDRQLELCEEWGMPDEPKAELRSILETDHDLVGEGATVTPFEDGDTFAAGDTELTALHAPGHSAGLSCFETADGEVLSGDALLPVYTPNVGGADVRLDRPLSRYIETLRTMIDRDHDRAWPGHRDPISDPAGRAQEIVEHHETRSWRVLDALRRIGPADAWEVSADLFGDLADIHILHGPGEAHAHLEHLEQDGVVDRRSDGYRLASGMESRVEDSRTWPL